MKASILNRFLALAPVMAAGLALNASAANLYWDGGTVDIAANGDGASTSLSGDWSTGIKNWDQGSALPHIAWNTGDIAIFGGATPSAIRTVTLKSDVTVGQLRIIVGGTGATRYDIGASGASTYAMTFNGSYSDATPAIDASGAQNTNFNAKIIDAVDGGMVIKHGSSGPSSGRFAFTNSANAFKGDVILLSGNFGAGNFLGDADNKLVLKGGALFSSGTATFTRNIHVAADSGIATATNGITLTVSGQITGTGKLTRSNTGSPTLLLSGEMSGYTGLFENTGGNVTIQTAAASAGTWKLTGGTVKLNTTDNTHIADGVGKSNLLMNGGTLDMNGKLETINGLSGATGGVLNNLATTTAALTLGAGDTTADFGGTLTNGAGTLALTKTGSGIQTLGGACSHTGATLIEDGTLLVSGTMASSPITVKSGAELRMPGVGRTVKSLSLEDGSGLAAPLDTNPTASDELWVTDGITFSGGTVTIFPVITTPPALGSYPVAFVPSPGVITGSATLLADFSTDGAARISGTAEVVGDNTIQVTITDVGADLVWTNAAATGVWNLNTDANFLNGADADVFKSYDTVAFNTTSPAGIITLAGALAPIAVSVNSPDDFTFAGTGSLTQACSLTKDGTGTLTIETTNTNSGTIQLIGGTLVVKGSLGTGALTANPGTFLRGTGSIAGPVTVGGTIAPGVSIGTLATGACNLSGTYACDIDGNQSDKLTVTGNLTLTDATLTLNEINPPTAPYFVIATCTGTVSGSFATIPEGYVVDTSAPGKVILWQKAATLPPAGAITYEQDQGYPAATGTIAGVNPGGTTNAPFSGVNGWSLSTSNAGGVTRSTSSSGEYFHGQAIGAADINSYIGAKKGAITVTGSNTVSFDSPYYTGTQVGLFKQLDGDGRFDGGIETSMSFGIGGSPGRFNYRNAAFGTENFGTGFTGIAGNWYRFAITIGASVEGNRAITMAVRDLTTGADYDFDTTTEGIQPWSFTVTDLQFGFAPELATGIFVRTSGPARVDNLRITSVAPPSSGGYAGWAAVNGVSGASDGDHDKDGVDNGIEFFMGHDSDGFSATPVPDSTGKITWTKGPAYAGAYGAAADFVVETSPDLATWTPVAEGDLSNTPTGVSYTLPENAGKIFARLKVMGPP